MSRQAPYFTRRYANRPRPEARFYGELRFVTLCFNSFPLACSLRGRLACCAVSAHVRRHAGFIRVERVALFMICMTKHFLRSGARKPGLARIARTPHEPCDTRAHRADYFEMVSSAMPFVRGPIHPIAAITTTIAPAMNANTPNVPKPRSTAAITNDEKIAEKRLHE